MLIDINKIIVNDRIRKDFGNIEELAEDIRVNGLINPPTVNKSYVLLAGERRLRACKLLGWAQIEVHMLDTKDEAHDLAVEMSENNMRRNFTGSELAEGIRRQMAIEAEKARERQGARTDIVQTFAEGSSGRARDKAAEQFGISGEQARKTLFVDDHRDMLDPADFADWDEGKLSTNKAFQRIKAAQQQAEQERDAAMSDAQTTATLYGQAKVQLTQAREDLAQERTKNLELGSEIANMERTIAEMQKPEVIEREVEVVREVVPDEVQERIEWLEHLEKIHSDDTQKLRRNLEKKNKEIERRKVLLDGKNHIDNASWDISVLTMATNNYLSQYGGKAWAFDQFDHADEVTQKEFIKAITSLAAFSQNLVQMISDQNLEA